jgi:hypothetical protein
VPAEPKPNGDGATPSGGDQNPREEDGPKVEPVECFAVDQVPCHDLAFPFYPWLCYGHTMQLIGPENSGKSTAAGAMGVGIVGGPALPGMDPRDDGYLFLAGSDEITVDLVQRRYREAGAPDGRVISLNHPVDGERRELEVIRDEAQIIADIGGRWPCILILDVFTDLLPELTTENDNDVAGIYWKALARIGMATRAAIISLGHPPWSNAENACCRARGAVKHTTSPDILCSIQLADEETHRHVLSMRRNKCGKVCPDVEFYTKLANGVPVVHQWAPLDMDRSQVRAMTNDPIEKNAVDECIANLMLWIPKKGISQQDMRKKLHDANIKQRTYERAKKILRTRFLKMGKEKTSEFGYFPPVKGWPKAVWR